MTLLPHETEPTSIDRFNIYTMDGITMEKFINVASMGSENITVSDTTDPKHYMTPEQELEVSLRVQNDEHRRQLASARLNTNTTNVTPTPTETINDIEQDRKLTPEEEKIEQMARKIRGLERDARLVQRQLEWKKNKWFKLEFIR